MEEGSLETRGRIQLEDTPSGTNVRWSEEGAFGWNPLLAYFALGMDRIVKEFVGAPSLRDVIAFPKTTAARALFEGAPIRVSGEELEELHLRPAQERSESPGGEPGE